MTEKLQQIAKDEIVKLPREGQEAINSFPWGETAKSIGLKYSLTEEEINNLQTEVLITLVGYEYLEDLKSNIENNVGITSAEAEKISSELINKIYNPIGAKLNEIVERSDKSIKANWQQNVNFIVSGGNYVSFIQEPEQPTIKKIPKEIIESKPTIKPERVGDLRDKFTI